MAGTPVADQCWAEHLSAVELELSPVELSSVDSSPVAVAAAAASVERSPVDSSPVAVAAHASLQLSAGAGHAVT